LKNPRHYNQTRDIGELLSATRYADDKDLQHEEEEDESDLSDIVVPDGYVEYESDAESDSDSDEGCRKGMEVTSPGGKKRTLHFAHLVSSQLTPGLQLKKQRAQQRRPRERAPLKVRLKRCPRTQCISPLCVECQKFLLIFDRDSLNDFIVDDGVSDGDASYESSATETKSRQGKSAQGVFCFPLAQFSQFIFWFAAGSPKKPSKKTPKKLKYIFPSEYGELYKIDSFLR
jgi:hypothetical protein